MFIKKINKLVKYKANEGASYIEVGGKSIPHQNKDLDIWICLESLRNAKGPACLSEQRESDSEDWRFYYTPHRIW